MAQRTDSLQKGDQILIFRFAVVGEWAGPVEVDAIITSTHPTGDRLGLDVAGPRRRTAGFEAGVHHDDVALVTLDNGNGVVDHCGVARSLAPQHHRSGVAFWGENDCFTMIARIAHRLYRLVARELLTINFNDQVDGRIAAASPSIVVELQPVLFCGVQPGDRLGYCSRTLSKADLVAVRRDAVVVERPSDVHATGTRPTLNRAIVRESSGGRVRLKTRIHHESRALGQKDGVADATTRVNRQGDCRLATAKHRHVHRLGVWPSLGKSKRDRAVGVVIGDGYAWVAAGQRDDGVSVLNQANWHLDSDLRGVVAGTKVRVGHRGRDTGVSDHLKVVERVFEVSAVAKQRDVVRVETTLLCVLH